MFENAFNNIDRELRNEEGTASELDYAEQTSWLLFLKYLDDLETQRADIAELEGNAYEAAKRAGAQHVVNLSASPVDTDFLGRAPVFMWHAESERRLRALGVAWTILRPGLFASGVIKMWRIMESGGLYLPSGDGKDVPIDPRDVAAVAVKVLTTPGHEGKVYELTGPELLSYTEVVQK